MADSIEEVLEERREERARAERARQRLREERRIKAAVEPKCYPGDDDASCSSQASLKMSRCGLYLYSFSLAANLHHHLLFG